MGYHIQFSLLCYLPYVSAEQKSWLEQKLCEEYSEER